MNIVAVTKAGAAIDLGRIAGHPRGRRGVCETEEGEPHAPPMPASAVLYVLYRWRRCRDRLIKAPVFVEIWLTPRGKRAVESITSTKSRASGL